MTQGKGFAINILSMAENDQFSTAVDNIFTEVVDFAGVVSIILCKLKDTVP